MTKRTSLLVTGLLLFSTVASAGPNWQALTFSTTPANLPKLLAALDTLMTSAGPGAIPVTVCYRVAAIATEVFAHDLNARRCLTALVLGNEQEILNALDDVPRLSRRNNVID